MSSLLILRVSTEAQVLCVKRKLHSELVVWVYSKLPYELAFGSYVVCEVFQKCNLIVSITIYPPLFLNVKM